MAKYGKLPSKKYSIYHFDLLLLFDNGRIENNTLVCDKRASKSSLYITNDKNKDLGIDINKNSLLFSQTIKGLVDIKPFNNEEDYFEDIYVNIDFKNFLKTYNDARKFVRLLNNISNGIKLYVGEKEIHVVDYMKSSSMSKNSCMYYINKEYKDYINDRITFGMDYGKFIIAKWYAYSGLALSDATILENIKFKNGELVVIPDKEYKLDCDCITATSVDLLYNLADEFITIVDSIKGLYNNIDEITLSNFESFIKKQPSEIKKKLYSNESKLNNVKKQINCFLLSDDYVLLSNEQQDLRKKTIFDILEIYKENFNEINNYSLLDIKTNFIKQIKTVYDKYMNEPHKVFWYKFNVKKYPTVINKFDGEGLISRELCNQINNSLKKITGKKEDKFGFTYQIRLPFIKGIVNSCDIKEFFKEKGITHIKGLTFKDTTIEDEKYKYYPIENVKMIITKSQFKCASFIKNIKLLDNETPIDAYIRLLNKYDYSLGITNLEPTHTNKVNLNYQFFSTIPFNKRIVKKLVNLNREDYKKKTSINQTVKDIFKRDNVDNEKKVYEMNPKFFLSTSKFKKFRGSQLTNKKKAYLELKYICWGQRKYICGDLLELLYHSAYHSSDEKYKLDFIPLNKFYAPNSYFRDKEKCILLRNPHYSRNEVAVLQNYINDVKNQERVKYFSHLTGVLMYNPLTQLADRLGGADYDGDTIVVLSDRYMTKTMNDLLIKKEDKYVLKYPLIKIPSLTSNGVDFKYENKVKSLFDTFDNRVGLISNNSFKETFNLYTDINYNENHDRIAFYTIINGLEIDSAKQGIKPEIGEGIDNEMGDFFLDVINKRKYSKDEIKERLAKYENRHIIFKLLRNAHFLSSERLETIKLKSIINYDYVTIEKLEKMFIIYCTYLIINNIISKHDRIIKVQKDTFEKGSPLVNKIKQILRSNGMEEEKLIDFCMDFTEKVASVNVVKEYCDSTMKFHYLVDDNQKRMFVSNLSLKEPLTPSEEKIIFNFENDGYMLLYLLLFYAYNSIKGYENRVSVKQQDIDNYYNIVYKSLMKITKNDDYKSYFKDNQDEIKNKIARNSANIINKFGHYNPLDIENTYDPYTKEGLKYMTNTSYYYLTDQAKDIELDVYLCLKEINKDDIIFNILVNQLIKYLQDNPDLISEKTSKTNKVKK